jgi:cytochrome b561
LHSPSTPTRYDAATQVFHWLTTLLVLVAFFYGPTGSEAVVFKPGRNFDRELHETLGLWVFALTILRLLWRTGNSRPPRSPAPLWMEIAASVTHWALYALLLALPLTAITGSWFAGHPLTLLSGDIRPALPLAHATGMAILEVHAWLGDAILWLAGLHGAAAIYRHWVLKDNVLRSMLPGPQGARHE